MSTKLQDGNPGGLASGLYVVATPIGNADDITLRALKVLNAADLVLCEDTRVSAKLFDRHGIATRRQPYHEHNAEEMRPRVLARLEGGERIALISDAGTPLVSDPGLKLVQAVLAEGHHVTSLPGASAPLVALTLSGLPSDQFHFSGFLPPKREARRKAIQRLATVPGTLIFFESGSRLADCLADLADLLGGRDAALARELTKKFEEVRRRSLADLAAEIADQGAPKGEFVLLVGPATDRAATAEEIESALDEAMGRLSLKDAVAEVSAALDAPRKEVYRMALARRG